MDAEIQALQKVSDPVERAKRTSGLVARYQAAVTELSRIRREALETLIAQGMTHAQIAERIGMTRARVGQLLTSGPKTERAFLGTGTLTVALGAKREADKPEPAPVVAQEDFQAYEHLRELANTLGLDTRYEVIQPPGIVNLNRPDLVVICGPRLSPLVAQVLASDRHLGFERDQQGWYLVDHTAGAVYRSPMDAGEPGDYAYLGRLPRPDGRSTFLYLAGIHASGAAGAIHYLKGHLAEVYAEVRTRRFSTLIACQYDPATLEIAASKQLTPLYRPEGP